LTAWLERAGFEIMKPGLKALWNPTDDMIEECVAFGREIAVATK